MLTCCGEILVPWPQQSLEGQEVTQPSKYANSVTCYLKQSARLDLSSSQL